MQQYLTSTLAALVWVPTDVSLQAALASAAASAAFEHFCADLDACVLLATVDLSSGGCTVHLHVAGAAQPPPPVSSAAISVVAFTKRYADRPIDVAAPLQRQLCPVVVYCADSADGGSIASARPAAPPTAATATTSSTSSSTAHASSLRMLHSQLEHALIPAIRASVSGVAASPTSSLSGTSATRLQEASARLEEATALFRTATAVAAAAVPLQQLALEPEIAAAAVSCESAGRELTPAQAGLSPSAAEVVSRAETSLQTWITQLRAVAKQLDDRDTQDGLFIAQHRDTFAAESAKAASGAASSNLPEQLSWWDSMHTCLQHAQRQLDGHGVRLTVALLREAKKRFAVSAFESESSLQPLLARVSCVLALTKGFPIAALTAATDAPALAAATAAACEHLRKSVAASSAAKPVDLLRAQRLLWAVGDEVAACSVRVFQSLTTSGDTAGTSLLALPSETLDAVLLAWEAIEEAWRTGAAAVQKALEAARSTSSTSGGAGASASAGGGALLPTNSRPHRLGDHIRVAIEFRRNHAVFSELFASFLRDAGNTEAVPHKLLAEAARLSHQLDTAWSAAVSRAGDPLRMGGNNDQARQRWSEAIKTYDTAAATVESSLATAVEEALSAHAATDSQGMLPATQLQQILALFRCLQPWISVSRIFAILLRFQRVVLQTFDLQLTGIVNDAEAERKAEVTSRSWTAADESPLTSCLASLNTPDQPAPVFASRLQRLMALRQRVEDISSSIPVVLCLDMSIFGSDPLAWREQESCMRLSVLYERAVSLTDAASAADAWSRRIEAVLVVADGSSTSAEARSLLNMSAAEEASMVSFVRMRQPPFCVRRVAAEQLQAVSAAGGTVLSVPLPAPPSAVAADAPGPSQVAAIAVTFTVALVKLAREIRAVQGLGGEVAATVPTALRTLAVGVTAAQQQATALQTALATCAKVQTVVGACIATLSGITIHDLPSSAWCSRVADGLLARERQMVQQMIASACGTTSKYTWTSDGVDGLIAEAAAVSNGYLVRAESLLQLLQQVVSSLPQFETCAFSQQGFRQASAVSSQHLAAVRAASYGAEGCVLLTRFVCVAAAQNVRRRLHAALVSWSEAPTVRQTTRITAQGSIKFTTALDAVKAGLMVEVDSLVAIATAAPVPSETDAAADSSSTGFGHDAIMQSSDFAAELAAAYAAVCKHVDAGIAGADKLMHGWQEYAWLWVQTPAGLAERCGTDLRSWAVELKKLHDQRDALVREYRPSSQFGPVCVEESEVHGTVLRRLESWAHDAASRCSLLLARAIASLEQAIADANEHASKVRVTGCKGAEFASSLLELRSACAAVYGTLAAAAADSDNDSASLLWKASSIVECEKQCDAVMRGGLPPEWSGSGAAAAALGELRQTLQQHISALSAGLASGDAQRTAVHGETAVSDLVADLAKTWRVQKPVHADAADFLPSRAVQVCSSFEGHLAALSKQLEHAQAGRAALVDFINVIEVGAQTPMPASGAAAALSALTAEVRAARDVWAAVGAVWAEGTKLRNTNWMLLVPRTVRSQLDALCNQLADMPGSMQSWECHALVWQQLRQWRAAMSLVSELRGPALQDRHLREVGRILNLPLSLEPAPAFEAITLSAVLDAELLANERQLRDVIRSAQGELGIAQFLDEVAQHWEACTWSTAAYKNRTRVIRAWDELLSAIDDHLSSLASAKLSPFFGPFAREAAAWESRLTTLRPLLDTWIDVQRQWLYLDGLFTSSPDMKLHLPHEAQRFAHSDADLAAIVSMLSTAPQVLGAPCLSPGQPPIAVIRAGAKCSALLSAPVGTLSNRLSSLLDTLSRVQAGLTGYLDAQRASFPRFFFLCDDDLLELLSASKDPAAVRRHLPSMFAGIGSLVVEEGSGARDGDKLITAIRSTDGEELRFDEPVSVRRDGSVTLQEWLTQMVMRTAYSLAAQMVAGHTELAAGGTQALQQLLSRAPAQSTLQAVWIQWTSLMEDALTAGSQAALTRAATTVAEHLRVVTGLLSRGAGDSSTAEGTTQSTVDQVHLLRRKAEQAVIELVHKRDVSQHLVTAAAAAGGVGVDSFEWQCRMRAYLGSAASSAAAAPSSLVIHMGLASMVHAGEYAGVGDRLVQTPLTDKAYLTLTHALHLRLGGSPFGPAGTGKTETVKALGTLLGRLVLVFNCDDTFDFCSMGRIFSGLCRVGAFGCFDEFNRLDQRVLSAISQQILSIQAALASRAPQVELLDRSVTLHPDVGIFITMNPGYAGRSQLPDNLKSLFRPCAMVAPDSRLIATVMLFTQGFVNADVLGQQVTDMFRSAASQLSQQAHYDFGLRALKTVLTQAGHARVALCDGATADLGVAGEASAVVRSILANVLPKLVSADLAPFRTMLAQSFPEAQGETSGTQMLALAAAAVCERAGLQWSQAGARSSAAQVLSDLTFPLAQVRPEELRQAAHGQLLLVPSSGLQSVSVEAEANEWFRKVLQLAVTAQARHGLMLVGAATCGKSAAWRTCVDALSLVDGVRCEVHVIDPKVLTAHSSTTGSQAAAAAAKEQLYGRLDPATLEWRDGVFTATLRSILEDARGEMNRRHWIVFDGDVDPEWAESLNSVLDDNKLLTLPSGERLALPPNVRIILEVDSLKHATMATVSRCGMVYFGADTVSPSMLASQFLTALHRGSVPTASPANGNTGFHAAAMLTKAVSKDLQAKKSSASNGQSSSDAQADAGDEAAGVDDALKEVPQYSLLVSLGKELAPLLQTEQSVVQRYLAAAVMGVVPEVENVGATATKTRGGKKAAAAASATVAAEAAHPVMPVSPNALMQSFLGLLAQTLEKLVKLHVQSGVDATSCALRLRQWLLVGVMWAFGAPYGATYRRQLAASLALCPEAHALPLPVDERTAAAADGPSLFDFRFDLSSGMWTPWSAAVPALDLQPSDVLDTSLIVPTVDTVRNSSMLEAWISSHAPLVLCGPPGSGKTMLVNAVLSSPAGAWAGRTHAAWLSLSSATSPEYVLRSIEQYCEYVRVGDSWVLQPVPLTQGDDESEQGGASSPADTADSSAERESWLMVFCDEINLPAQDKYGTQRVTGLLRSLTELGGFWAPLKLEGQIGGGAAGTAAAKGKAKAAGPTGGEKTWVSLRRIQFVGACNPPTDAGRVPLPPRFLRHAPVLYLDYPAPPVMLSIFASFTNALCKLHSSLAACGKPLAAACLEAYTSNAGRFKPEAAPQYVYSPRELSRWLRALYEGLAPLAVDAGATHLITPTLLVRLWLHEGLRLFHDRLITAEDQAWCSDDLDRTAKKHFVPAGAAALVPDISVCLARPILFSDWTQKHYLPADLPALCRHMASRCGAFCEEQGEASIVVFEEAVEHVLRIDRVLKHPLGHLLLSGDSGVGKTLLTRFAAWLRGMPVFSLRVSHKYTLADFDRDLRTVMTRSGADGEKLVFIFDESNIISSAFLERMNALLASGEVPGLFDGEHRAALLAACVSAWGTKAEDSSEDAIIRRFTRNVQRNLHVVFTVNPVTSQLGGDRAATSPALFNRCVVDWWGTWTPAARAQVAAELLAASQLDSWGTVSGPYKRPRFVASADGKLSREAIALNGATAARLQSAESAGGADNGRANYTYSDAIVAALTLCYTEAVALAEQYQSSASAFRAHISPRFFIDSLRHFACVYAEKKESMQAQQKRVGKGLDRVKATEAQVSSMRITLAAKQRDLSAKNDAANAKLAAMVADQQEAEKQRAASMKLKKSLARQTEEVRKREEEVARELRDAEPALADARSSVQGINRQQLDELRSMASPPAPVKLCMEAVLTLMGNDAASLDWAEIRKALKQADFIPTVVNLRTESLSTKARRLVSDRYVHGGSKDFTFERVNGASKACGPLYKWVVSQLEYAAILERVEPLRAEAASLAAEREAVASESAEVERTLHVLEASINKYKEEYAVLIREAEGLRREMESVQTKTERASSLLSSLARERSRWERITAGFSASMQTLAPDVVVAASFLAYAGWADIRGRSVMEERWRRACAALAVPCAADVDVADLSTISASTGSVAISTLSTAAQRVEWSNLGAENDDAAMGNAVLLCRFRRFPLIVDPSGAAVEFLTRLRESAESGRTKAGRGKAADALVRASLLDTGYLKLLESATRFGTTLLLTDAEAVDAVLNPLLSCEVHRTGSGVGAAGKPTAGGNSSGVLVRIGEAEVDLSPSFQLYLFTRDAAAHFPPDVTSRVTVINYTVTSSGLCDTLVSRLLAREAPESQATCTRLLHSQAQADTRLAQLEDTLLSELAEGTAGTSLLDDDRVLVALEAIKAEASAIESARATAAAVLAEVATVSAGFAPIAQSVSEAYFTLQRATVAASSMYQFSLMHVLAGFDLGIASVTSSSSAGDFASATPDAQRTRICTLLQAALAGIAAVTCRSMFSQQALAWKVALLMNLHRSLCAITGYTCGSNESDKAAEVQLLLQAPRIPTASSELQKLVSPSSTSAWQRQLCTSLRTAAKEWASSTSPLPTGWEDSKDFPAGEAGALMSRCSIHLRRIAAAAHLRPAALSAVINDAANALFSASSTVTCTGQLDAAAVAGILQAEATAATPTLLLCTPGTDVEALMQSAAAGNIAVRSVSMGASDSLAAANGALEACSKQGSWLLLRNVHLAVEWVQTCMKKLVRDASALHASFRLVMTAEIPQMLEAQPAPSCPLPPDVLLGCSKLLLETPVGLKASFARSAAVCLPGATVGSTGSEVQLRLRLLLSWCHALLLERRRYTPAGWSKPYDFADSDLLAACHTADMALRSSGSSGSSGGDSRQLATALHAVQRFVASALHGSRTETSPDSDTLHTLTGALLTADALMGRASLSLSADVSLKLPPPASAATTSATAALHWIAESVAEDLSPSVLGLAADADQQLRVRVGCAVSALVGELEGSVEDRE